MPLSKTKSKEELLVGIVNRVSDFKIIKNQHWYRIPIDKAEKHLKRRWPPKWIAFYYTTKIKDYSQTIINYAQITDITKASRKELFPFEKKTHKAHRNYYKISFERLLTLPKPILSQRKRVIIFIQTTYKKFMNAVEINDLFDDSNLENKLWAEFKKNRISAERQEVVKVDDNFYFLDFAIHCKKGKLDVETDGDKYHHNPASALKDNLRSNDLTTNGWSVIRFNSQQIREKIELYCIPMVKVNINNLGGIDFDKTAMERFKKQHPYLVYPNYFDDYE
ncbi:MAG: endonuclease domain-containing protein [Candidatus Lokiarchaeota archaeon]|nr:endonuclease domain-containing protein [Candidatus Lokiarchaeota archaeon]